LGRFVERVNEALDAVAATQRPAAAALDEMGRDCWTEARRRIDRQERLEDRIRELEAHSERLLERVGDLTREAAERSSRDEALKTELYQTTEALLTSRRLVSAHESRFFVRVMNRRPIARVYQPLRWVADVLRREGAIDEDDL
jgi:hypothetical protein